MFRNIFYIRPANPDTLKNCAQMNQMRENVVFGMSVVQRSHYKQMPYAHFVIVYSLFK